MNARPILAKSSFHGKDVTLAEHTREVLRATSAMFGDTGSPTRLSLQWLRFFGLHQDDFEAFFQNLWLAAATHDLGKANSGFQHAARHEGEQTIRHEHLSALLLWQTPLQDWLRAYQPQGVDPEIIISAVVSHHLKVNDQHFARPLIDSERAAVRVLMAAPDVASVLGMATRTLGGRPPDASVLDRLWTFSRHISAAREPFAAAMHRFRRTLERDERRKRLLLAVKAALISVDSVGSAVLRMGQGLEEWLRAAFGPSMLNDEDVEDLVISPRVREMENAGRWRGFHDFQLAAGESGPRLLLLSGCGTGKTLAAWKWIKAQLQRREASRLIFLYPTRATATEGFRDYVAWAGPELAALVHGTSQYDLEGMFSNPLDARVGKDYTVPDRLFALGYWHRRIFSATVDSFLAFMSHSYAALCMVPLLADSVIVFDEAHSFDRSMFRALERFLTFFDIPVLCMTASLPSNRVRVLTQQCRLDVFPCEPGQFSDLERQSNAPRYRVHRCNESDAYNNALQAAREQKRVLWVVNTVARCQDIARRLSEELKGMPKVLCYHSRFRLNDRRRRHEQTIAAFRSAEEPCVLISTQVCEMSLDLDADVLITEAAPVPAIIQRMGRCCREPLPATGRLGMAYIYRPAGTPPYTREEIEQGSAFAEALEAKASVTQADLSAYLEHMPDNDPIAAGGFSGFLDSSWYAMARDDTFREGEEYTVDCVLDSDLDAYMAARAEGSGQTAGFIVPVPLRLARPNGASRAYPRVAPSSHYSESFGFLTQEVSANG